MNEMLKVLYDSFYEKLPATQLKAEIERCHDNFEKYLTLIRKYTDVEELNAYILNELIEKIVVHEKVVDEDGNKSQQIDIYYKYVDPPRYPYGQPAVVCSSHITSSKTKRHA